MLLEKEGGRKRGRLDSIKPKAAGKLFGILHFSSEFLGDFSLFLSPLKDFIHDLKKGKLL